MGGESEWLESGESEWAGSEECEWAGVGGDGGSNLAEISRDRTVYGRVEKED